MDPEEVKRLIEAGIPGSQVNVKGDGSHFDAVVISEAFDGLTPVKKQQLVYATVNEQITSGQLHALSIKTYTPDEWEKASKLQISS
jgi:acid stress-induced BolA-like protein IbaG/YrbA